MPDYGKAALNQIKDMAVTVKQYGAKCDGITNDQTYIQNAINDVSSKGGGTVYLLPNHLINGVVNIANNVTVRALTVCTVKTTSGAITFQILPNTVNAGLEDITFDYGGTFTNQAVYVYENVKELKLRKLRFRNFYNGDPTVSIKVMYLKTGITGYIKDCSFYNITGLGNGTITDNGGSINCIHTNNYGVTDFQNYALSIDNIHFENCYNVDANKNPIVEDSDMIHFTHGKSVDGTINVSNITAKNINKRVIKIQGKGVNISNVALDAKTHVPWMIAVMDDNVNISNISGSGDIKTAIEFLDAVNCNVTGVQIQSTYAGSTTSDSLFKIHDSSNLNISGVNGSGYGGFLVYGEQSENIDISNVNLTLKAQILYLQGRNTANTAYTGGFIKNFTMSRVSFNIPTTSYNSPLFDIGTGTVNPIQQLQFRDVRITANQAYQYGLIRIKDAADVLIDNLYVINNSTLTNPTLLYFGGATNVQIRRLGITGNASTAQLQVFDTASVLVTRGSFNNALLSGTSSKLELEKTPNVTVSYTASATSSQVTTT